MGEPSRSATRPRRRWRRVFVGLLFFLIIAGAGIWIWASHYGAEFLRGQLETVLTSVLEQPVRIDALIVRPGAGEFGAAGFSIGKGPGSNESMVTLGKALVTLRMPRLWPPEIVAKVAINDLDLDLEATPGPTEQASEPLDIALPSSFEVGPLTIRLESARLDRGGFVYRDPAAEFEIQIQGIDATLTPAGKGFGADVSVGSLSLRFPGGSESLEQLRLHGAIDPDRIDVEELALRYAGEPLVVEGAVEHPFNELALDLELRGKIPLHRLDRYLRSPDWPFSGLLQIEGSVRGPIPSLQASWTARAPELRAGRVRATDLQLKGDWDSRTLRISELAADLFGGALHASFEMAPEDLSATRANLKVSQVSLAALDVLAEKPLKLEGTLDLDAEAAGDPTQLRDMRARVEVDGREIVLPGDAAALGRGRIALAASLEKGLATLSKLNARWQAAEVSASGTANLDGPFDVRTDLTVTNMTELAKALHWKGFDGKAVFDTTAKGNWQEPRVDGEVRGQLTSASGSEIGKLEVPFRMRETELEIPRAFVYLGRTRLDSSIAADWKGEPRFDGKIEARPVRLEDLAIFMPAELQAGGAFNVTAEAKGTQKSWRGSARVDAEDLSVAELFLKDVQIGLSANQQGLSVERLALSLNGVPVEGEGRWAWSGSGKTKLVIGPAEFSRIRGIPQETALRGRGKASVQGSVEGQTINATGELSVEDAAVDELPLGSGRLGFTVKDSNLNADLGFPGLKLSGKAEGKLAPGGKIAVELGLENFAVAPVLEVFAPDAAERINGEVTAKVEARFPFEDPMRARGSLRIDPLRLDLAGERLENAGPIAIEVQEGNVRVAKLALESASGGRLSASGTLTQFEDVDFSTAVKLPLKLLTALSPEITRAGGNLELNAQISGKVDQPVIRGGGRIENGTVAFASYPDALREIEGEFAFTPKGGQLKRLTALLGRGQIEGSGQVGLEGFAVGAYQAKLTLRELPVAPIEGLRTTWNADLELLGFEDRGIIQGQANLLRGSYSRELSILSLLFERRPSSAGGGGSGEPSAVDLTLRVRVNLKDNFLVRTPLARLRAGGSITVEGPVTDPVIFGSIEVRDGYVTFQKRRFDLSRAVVNFANPRQIDPSLDIEAKAKIREYDVTLQLSGRPEDLTITLSSDPSLPEEDLLSLVAFGVTREQFGRSAPGVLAGQAAQLIADDLFGASESVLDNIDVDTQGQDGSTVSVGAKLGENTRVSFARGTGSNGKQKIRIEHQLLGPLLIAGGRDQDGFETDVVLRFRFR